jgi:arylsulfatase A-like enzyme
VRRDESPPEESSGFNRKAVESSAVLTIRFTVKNILLLLCALSVGVGAEQRSRPNIVFLLADDMRPDCIRALGHPVIETPNLDALVREGFVFSRAVAAYPICHVSRAEILTGTTAFRNGVGYRGTTIDPSLKTWAGTLRAAGYLTWYCGKWHNDGKPTERGYDETRGLFTSGGVPKGARREPINDHAGRPATGYVGWTFKTNDGKVELEKGVGLTPGIDRHIADAAIELVRRKPDDPFFLHVNFTAPHDPRLLPPGYERKYDPAHIPLPKNFRPQHPFDHGNLNGRDELLLPKPLDEDKLRAELAAYYACVSYMDGQIGRIIAALRETGQFDNTVIVFSSDQGLAIGSHGLLGKQNLYEHTFRVPMIFRGPGIPRGRRSTADCYLRDLFPTVCDLTGTAIPPTVESRSLAPLLNGTAESVHPFVTGYFTDTQRALRRGDWKLIHYPRIGKTQLFDLHSDPDEMSDLAGKSEHAVRINEMIALLQKTQHGFGDACEITGSGPNR